MNRGKEGLRWLRGLRRVEEGKPRGPATTRGGSAGLDRFVLVEEWRKEGGGGGGSKLGGIWSFIFKYPIPYDLIPSNKIK